MSRELSLRDTQITQIDADCAEKVVYCLQFLVVHVFVIPLVVAGGDVVHPGLVVEIPTDGALDAFLELQGGLPAQFALELGGVDGIAQVVTGTVGDIGDEVYVCAFGAAEQTVNGMDEDLDYIDVLPLVEATDVVCLGDGAFVEDEVDGTGMVFYIEPIAHVLALAIDGQGFAMAYVVDEERDELFRELIGSVVIGAVGDDGGHTEGVVEGAHEMVAGCLGSAIGTVWLILEVLGEELLSVCQMVFATGCLGGEGGLYTFGVGHLECAIYFVGTDVIKTLAFVFLWQGFPIELCCLKEGEGAHDIGLGKGEGVFDGAVYMALCSKVDDAIDFLCLHEGKHSLEVADVHLHEAVVGPVLDVLEVGEVACIGEFVQIDDAVLRVFVHEKAHDMASDEAGASCDDDSPHRFWFTV